jgi:hypothetical protein
VFKVFNLKHPFTLKHKGHYANLFLNARTMKAKELMLNMGERESLYTPKQVAGCSDFSKSFSSIYLRKKYHFWTLIL